MFDHFVWLALKDLKTTYFTSYTDDNTPFVVRDNITDVIKAVEEIRENLESWFPNNKMKLNTDKCHLLLKSQEPSALKKVIYI